MGSGVLTTGAQIFVLFWSIISTWLYLWWDEYKSEDNGKTATYRCFTEEVFASGDTTYRPWDALDNRTGKYPYSCHFELIYSNEEQQGVVGPDLNITSRAGETVATTFARRATQVGSIVTPTSTSLSLAVSSISHTASSSSSPTATSSPSASVAPPAGDNGLSTGAKAGIAMVAIFAVIALAAIGYLFYRNHRKLKELVLRIPSRIQDLEPKNVATEYYRQDYQPVPPSELEQHQTYELPAQPQEMEGVEHAKR
ncbi:hypothetical protein ST47_g6047 [Ascochyta rabiei]|uniref:Mid2 domain-containing protein n=1 Tax=Didymella rabiei TaxID=5454 RepID=A0A163CYH3_DIDRA|nr:hypothetical protein ST47_g6047 [Ascochyta rabiei]